MKRPKKSRASVVEAYDRASDGGHLVAEVVGHAESWSPMSLDRLADAVQGNSMRSQRAEMDLVMHLRDQGVSWADVGRVLGISRQGAQQRFAIYDRSDER